MSYFTIGELTRSATATARGIDNTPDAAAVNNLHLLIANVLDPLRQAWGKPVIVTSGYRCRQLNKAVGGSRTSHHMKGMAADITAGSKTENKKLFNLALKLRLPFCQLIDEKNFSWVHISYDPGNIKRQVLRL